MKIAALVVALGLGVHALPAEAADDDAFYRGKIIRIVVGASAGGGFDAYSRVIARHMGKHIPGAPTIIVENMPGAGSLIAANHLYRVAKPDGLTVGNFIGNLFLGQVLGQKGIEFDARKFEYLGAPVRDHLACALTRASGITSLEKWRAAPAPVKIGAIAAATPTSNVARVLKTALGLPIQVITGYKGTAEIRLAAEVGEVAGACWNWGSIRATWRKALDAGDVAIVLQVAPKSHPDLAGVPLAINLVRSEEGRRLIEVGVHNDSALVRSYTLPPGTPKARVQTLRTALQATLRDPAFLAEADKVKLEVDPVDGAEIEGLVARLFTLEPPLVARLRTILLE
jgi:tripartite-type tricarboxylate transporter receptor subunit TctC